MAIKDWAMLAVQSLLALAAIGTTLYLVVTSHDVPDILAALDFAVVALYFPSVKAATTNGNTTK